MGAAKRGAVITAVDRLVPGLRRGAGSNWLGFCPIHGEQPGRSKPSFSFNEATGQWHCFAGCGGGGLAQLLKKLNKPASFVDRTMERLRPLLKDAPRKKLSAQQEGVFHAAYPLPERLLGLYEYAPVDLLEQGFSEAVLQDNDVGFDPKLERIVYPVRDMHGVLAGIVGKPVHGDGPGKYVVYEQELRDLGFKGYSFSNHDYMWRWEQVYAQVYGSSQRQTVCVVEGFKAALWLVQAGFPLTVALMGTSLSNVQLRFLQRLGTKTVLCLDDDAPGRIGTRKASYRMKGLDTYIMRYPFRFDLQPDDLTFDEVREAILNPLTPTQWRRSNGT